MGKLKSMSKEKEDRERQVEEWKGRVREVEDVAKGLRVRVRELEAGIEGLGGV